jgi:hypothetical protein
MALFALAALATPAEMYFSSDKNGANRVTNIQEGDAIWVVVYDPDQNIDCDIRDKMWVDLKVFDPKTGAYIVWDNGNYIGDDGDLNDDYLEETGADTGLFVSSRAFQVGTRAGFVNAIDGRHALPADAFQWGNFSYVEGRRGWFDCEGGFTNIGGIAPPPPPPAPQGLAQPMMEDPVVEFCGRFENMDTLVGMYQDPNDATDVAVGMMKIIDTEATISWGQEIYKDANGSAKITVIVSVAAALQTSAC